MFIGSIKYVRTFAKNIQMRFFGMDFVLPKVSYMYILSTFFMTFFDKARIAFTELKNTIEDNLDKLTDKAEQFIQDTTEEIEDSLEQVEDAAEDVWEDAKHFVEERRQHRK